MMEPFHKEKEHRGAESRSGEEDAELRFCPVEFQVMGGWPQDSLGEKAELEVQIGDLRGQVLTWDRWQSLWSLPFLEDEAHTRCDCKLSCGYRQLSTRKKMS